jgi:hypothetical protein
MPWAGWACACGSSTRAARCPTRCGGADSRESGAEALAQHVDAVPLQRLQRLPPARQGQHQRLGAALQRGALAVRPVEVRGLEAKALAPGAADETASRRLGEEIEGGAPEFVQAEGRGVRTPRIMLTSLLC